MNTRRIVVNLMRVLTIVAVVGLLFIGYRVFVKSSIALEDTDGVTKILIDGKQIEPSESSVSTTPGKHKIEVFGPLVKPTTHLISIAPFSEVRVSTVKQTYSKEELAKQLLKDSSRNSREIGVSELFENNNWLVFSDYDNSGETDTSMNIYLYKNGEWKTALSGTGFSYHTVKKETLPRSIIEYFKELDEKQ